MHHVQHIYRYHATPFIKEVSSTLSSRPKRCLSILNKAPVLYRKLLTVCSTSSSFCAYIDLFCPLHLSAKSLFYQVVSSWILLLSKVRSLSDWFTSLCGNHWHEQRWSTLLHFLFSVLLNLFPLQSWTYDVTFPSCKCEWM